MTCQEFNDLMIDYIEGHLTLKQKRAIKVHLKSCSQCQTALYQYKNFLEKLHQIPQLKCPDLVIERVFDSIKINETKESRLLNIYEVIAERLSWKISLAAAMVVIILMIYVFYPDRGLKDYDGPTYTAEEIEQAKKDVELALGYFHHYAKKTGVIIEEQVFSKPIVKPIKSSVKLVFKPLLSGGKL